ncbi:MAG: D-Ala-D-Ala carboxypeptidase family metallohydrolase [Elainellaceae cyanobacterium]
MVDEIRALENTWLKKDYRIQSDLLTSDRKLKISKGKVYKVTRVEERDAGTDMGGHFQVDIAHGAGTWYLFGGHWHLPWQEEPKTKLVKLPEWNEVNWSNWKAPVSKYFTVGEVTLRERERIPASTQVKKNVILAARQLDDIRDWWGSPLGINSWYRPWHVNTRIGSRAPNHPNGYGVDFRPMGGSIWEMQKRFESEWYNKGRWKGGFGRGARKGFVHIDLRGKRVWNY